jgi:uncharacterized protein
MSFLKAEWRKLAIANYLVDPEVLLAYLPAGTELDLFKGKCYVSLVGFMFVNTKLLGVKIPFHTNFEEVNLRFYVKRFENGEWKRGVVFIKEIVPKFALTFVANTFYKEHYETLPMKHKWEVKGEDLNISYEWKKNGVWQRFALKSSADAVHIEPDSETEFITEHYWGYAKVNDRTTNEYEVTHPKWMHYPVKEYLIEVDFGQVYGSDFGLLNELKPYSVMLAEGSEISVESKRKIVSSLTED